MYSFGLNAPMTLATDWCISGVVSLAESLSSSVTASAMLSIHVSYYREALGTVGGGGGGGRGWGSTGGTMVRLLYSNMRLLVLVPPVSGHFLFNSSA